MKTVNYLKNIALDCFSAQSWYHYVFFGFQQNLALYIEFLNLQLNFEPLTKYMCGNGMGVYLKGVATTKPLVKQSVKSVLPGS